MRRRRIWRTLWQVLVRPGRPALVTLTVLVFMWTWNEFLTRW